MISLHGTSRHHEKIALLLARFNFETFPDLWDYEPASIEEIGLETDVALQELHWGRFNKVPHASVFTFGTSVKKIKEWFQSKSEN